MKSFSMFKMLLNPLKFCPFCNQRICEECQVQFEFKQVSWLCRYCAKLKQIDELSGAWFYTEMVNFPPEMEGVDMVREALINDLKNEELHEETTLRRMKAILDEMMEEKQVEINANEIVNKEIAETVSSTAKTASITKMSSQSSLSITKVSQDFSSILGIKSTNIKPEKIIEENDNVSSSTNKESTNSLSQSSRKSRHQRSRTAFAIPSKEKFGKNKISQLSIDEWKASIGIPAINTPNNDSMMMDVSRVTSFEAMTKSPFSAYLKNPIEDEIISVTSADKIPPMTFSLNNNEEEKVEDKLTLGGMDRMLDSTFERTNTNSFYEISVPNSNDDEHFNKTDRLGHADNIGPTLNQKSLSLDECDQVLDEDETDIIDSIIMSGILDNDTYKKDNSKSIKDVFKATSEANFQNISKKLKNMKNNVKKKANKSNTIKLSPSKISKNDSKIGTFIIF